MPFEVYTDEGISGTWDINKRPEFSRMLDDIDDGKIKVVYAYHPDRIERNPQTRYFFNDLLRNCNTPKVNLGLLELLFRQHLYNDLPMEIVSELLGHSSMKITQEYYGKVVQRKVSEEIFRLIQKSDFREQD